MALTLLRAPLVPDDTCDRGRHQFTYALMPFDTSFADSDLARAGKELNVPIRVVRGQCAEGNMGLSCESDSILIDTVKPAEDGQGMILRCYESLGTASEGVLRLPRRGDVYLSSMDEREKTVLEKDTDRILLSLKPFEIQTLRIDFPNITSK